jgi:hypothetical protein
LSGKSEANEASKQAENLPIIDKLIAEMKNKTKDVAESEGTKITSYPVGSSSLRA